MAMPGAPSIWNRSCQAQLGSRWGMDKYIEAFLLDVLADEGKKLQRRPREHAFLPCALHRDVPRERG
jgi:hypothetical protein